MKKFMLFLAVCVSQHVAPLDLPTEQRLFAKLMENSLLPRDETELLQQSDRQVVGMGPDGKVLSGHMVKEVACFADIRETFVRKGVQHVAIVSAEGGDEHPIRFIPEPNNFTHEEISFMEFVCRVLLSQKPQSENPEYPEYPGIQVTYRVEHWDNLESGTANGKFIEQLKNRRILFGSVGLIGSNGRQVNFDSHSLMSEVLLYLTGNHGASKQAFPVSRLFNNRKDAITALEQYNRIRRELRHGREFSVIGAAGERSMSLSRFIELAKADRVSEMQVRLEPIIRSPSGTPRRERSAIPTSTPCGPVAQHQWNIWAPVILPSAPVVPDTNIWEPIPENPFPPVGYPLRQ